MMKIRGVLQAASRDDSRKRAFTLMELLVVILVIGVLAAASIPIMRGKIDEAKWTEAKAAAGTIRRAEKIYYTQTGKTVKGRLSAVKVLEALNLEAADLTGTYFVAKDYRITQVDADGNARIRIKGSQENAPKGKKFLEFNGDWN